MPQTRHTGLAQKPTLVRWACLLLLFAHTRAAAARTPLLCRAVLCCACVSRCQASSAYKHSLKEVLALPAIASKIKDTKAAREVSALQEFYAMLTADSSRAFYGPGHVLAAAELGAIQTLLISGGWMGSGEGQAHCSGQARLCVLPSVAAAGGGGLCASGCLRLNRSAPEL